MDDTSHHYGKGMANFDPATGTATFTMECASCGKQEIKVNVEHLRVTIQLMEQLADGLGLDKDFGNVEVVRKMSYGSKEQLVQAKQDFEELPIETALNISKEPSAWDD